MVLVGAVADLLALQELLRDVWIACCRNQRGQPIQAGENTVLDGARLDSARPAGNARNPEAAFKYRALGGAERRHSAIGPGKNFGAVVGREDADVCVRGANIVEGLEQIADAIVELRHSGFFETVVALIIHLRLVLLLQEGEDVYARGVVPNEERFAGALGTIHESLALLDENIVEGLHVVFGVAAFLPKLMIRAHVLERLERAFVDNALFAYP